MSLIGIDMGSSSVKISVYTEDGELMAVVNHSINPLHLQPGWWETDPEDVWRATKQGLSELAAMEVVYHDPPVALAISASGRENFPADEHGNPLGNNLMGADTRGEEFEIPPEGSPVLEDWCLACGHLRERMDPVMRLLWWRQNHPEIFEQARQFPDWHGFLTLRLCGRNVSERSLVGRWAIYDIATKTWSQTRLAEYAIESYLLPEVLNWGEVIGEVKHDLARELGLPERLKIVTGGHDLNCAAIGTGTSSLGSACLISGSYENILIPTTAYPTASMLLSGLSVTPHLGKIERSIYAICPTGNAVVNWAHESVKISIEELNSQLEQRLSGPSSVLALPYLSGAMLYWQGGRKLRGGLLGMTLATTPLDIVQSFMESIAYDHANTFRLLKIENIPVDQILATGGGTRSTWWTQLKADILGIPIQVAAEPEPGTLGAALLAGVGCGVYRDLDEASSACLKVSRQYEPDLRRAAQYEERLETYRSVVPQLLSSVFERWH